MPRLDAASTVRHRGSLLGKPPPGAEATSLDLA